MTQLGQLYEKEKIEYANQKVRENAKEIAKSLLEGTVNPLQRNTAGSSPAPSTLRLRVRVVYGAILLRWCASTHRRFKSFRKRS